MKTCEVCSGLIETASTPKYYCQVCLAVKRQLKLSHKNRDFFFPVLNFIFSNVENLKVEESLHEIVPEIEIESDILFQA